MNTILFKKIFTDVFTMFLLLKKTLLGYKLDSLTLGHNATQMCVAS